MTNSQFDVLGIGNAIVDILSHADDDYLNLRGISKGAMNLIDEERAESLYAETGPAIEVSGGSAANTAAWAAREGVATRFVGAIGDDITGDFLHRELAGHNVDVQPVVAVSQR